VKQFLLHIEFYLKGQSHEKEIWDVNFGLTKGSPTVFKILKSPFKSYDFSNRGTLDVTVPLTVKQFNDKISS
jgi:hypothetical protein